MALEARLSSASRQAGGDLNRLRRRAVFERILVRLDAAQQGRWVLKGGMALELRWHERARATRDLDLAVRGEAPDSAGLRSMLAAALERDPHSDWFQFTAGTARELTADAAGRPGWRFPVEARLAGRRFAQVSLDVVARPEEIRGTERIPLTGLLAFAGIPDSSIEVVDRAQHFAEKLHALTQTYGDRPNTRTRDLVDLLMLVEDGLQPRRELLERVSHVFSIRNGSQPPAVLSDPPREWAPTYSTLAAGLDVEADTLDRAMDHLRAFWALVRSTEET
jgi:predicted nucleotidyltransferase component of viral defense system